MTKKYKLDDICDFINGGAWSDKEYSHKGIPVLKVSNFKPNGFEIDSPSYLPTDAITKYEKNLLTVNDLVIATVGSHPNLTNSAAGRSCIIPESISGYLLNQNAVCVRSKDEDVLNQKYLCYLGQMHEFKHYIQSRGKGAANQMRIAIGAIKDYEVVLSPLPTQRRIAEILSAYDDLIENNQKQIKLLEEAAMLLYKEWFVKLRFPGHENAKIVDGVPTGWQKTVLGNVVNIKKGKNITKATVNTGVIPVVAGGIEPAYYHSLHNAIAPVVTISASGANAGFTNLYQENIWASDCSYISADETEHVYFYYLFLMVNKVEIHNMQKGAAQPHVYPKDLMSLSVLYPESIILEQFSIVISQYFKKVSLLKQETQKARTARDKLLPKLICGEIEV